MKKFVLLALVALGIVYMKRSLADSQQHILQRNERLKRRGPALPQLPQPVVASPWVGDPYAGRLNRVIPATDTAKDELRYGRRCRYELENYMKLEMTRRIQGSTKLQRWVNIDGPGNPILVDVSDAERAADSAETRQFIEAHGCSYRVR